jgi:uncharacterized membrane protein YagU involved in acid resistance
MATHATRYRADLGSWVRQGALGGFIAGIVFAMFEMVMAALMNGVGAFFMPLRMIGAMVLGRQALDPGYSLATAGITGMVVHMMLSVVFGMVFAAIVHAVPALRRSHAVLISVVSTLGLLLWPINFYVIAPLFGWDWFPNNTNPLVQFIAHTFMYGTVLGLYLSRAIPHERRA